MKDTGEDWVPYNQGTDLNTRGFPYVSAAAGVTAVVRTTKNQDRTVFLCQGYHPVRVQKIYAATVAAAGALFVVPTDY